MVPYRATAPEPKAFGRVRMHGVGRGTGIAEGVAGAAWIGEGQGDRSQQQMLQSIQCKTYRCCKFNSEVKKYIRYVSNEPPPPDLPHIH